MSKTTIEMKSGSHLCKVTVEGDNGSVSVKNLTMKQIIESFQLEKPQTYYLPHPMFNEPDSGRVEGLLAGSAKDNTLSAVFFIPAESRFMNVLGEKCILPYPSVIFAMTAENGRLTSSKCYAVKEKNTGELRMNSALYSFPFGNVQPGSGHICWGNNKLPQLGTYTDMREAVTMFFCSESNKDYVRAGETFKGYKSFEDYLRALKKMDKFPQKALVETNRTLRCLIDSIRNMNGGK